MSGERGLDNGEISTPWDDLFPSDVEPAAQYYLDVIRIYLGLYAGTVTFDQAIVAGERLKENPEYVKYPTNPILYPINERMKGRALENLETLNKYRIYTRDSIRSAMGFTFLKEVRPIPPVDLTILKFLMREPLISLNKTSGVLGFTPRTISNAIKRMRSGNDLRFSSYMDPTAFGMNSYMLFFKLQSGVKWDDVINIFSEYPFTRSILKVSTSDLGYVSILIPGMENDSVFRKSVRKLPRDIFDYISLHEQQSVHQTYNLSLFHDNTWELPELSDFFSDTREIDGEITSSVTLVSKGQRKYMDHDEFVVASQIRLDSRAIPSTLSQMLEAKGFGIEPQQVGQISRRLYKHEVLVPYVSIGGMNLSTNYCFEIVCNEDWTERLVERVSYLPSCSSLVSSRGIIVLAQVPSYHQVEYYRLFESLESEKGINSVEMIMTLAMMGGRLMTQMARYWNHDLGKWSVHSAELDLRNYFDNQYVE